MTDVAPPRPARRRRSSSVADPGTPRPPIRTRVLTKKYGDFVAVDQLDLEVRPGEIFGLLGQNGAGKTTTILMLLGLTEPSGGTARVVGLDPARRPLEVKRRVGYLPDAVGFYGNLTGRQNLRYTARLNGLAGEALEGQIEHALEQVGLAGRADTRTDTYSRGMLQRLGIADALLKDPDVLILDEPTTSIDPIGVVEILDLLRRLVRERGMTILLSSHLLGQVQSVCDRVGIFASGKLIGVGTVPELSERFGDGAAHVEVGFAAPESGADSPEAGAGALDAATGSPERIAPSAEAGAASLDAGATLRALANVDAVTWDPASVSWRLTVRPAHASPAVREAILRTTLDKGLRLTSLRVIEPSLDEIYRTAVASMATAGVTTEVGS